jgi:hypothetical protein
VNRFAIDNSAYLEENRALKRMLEQFNARKIALDDNKQKLNSWGLESNKQRNEIINGFEAKDPTSQAGKHKTIERNR